MKCSFGDLKAGVVALLVAVTAVPGAASSQRPAGPPPGPQGPGGPGRGPMGPPAEQKLVARFDRDGDKRLNADERRAAREFLSSTTDGRGRGRPGGPGPFAGTQDTPTPGVALSPNAVTRYRDEPLYAIATLRTIFLRFDQNDWEKELMTFANTDVDIPVEMSVDGKTYRDVGVHFRGSSSFFTVPEGRKHSLNLSLDFVHDGQQLGGYRTLNLLNSHTDPTFLRTVLSTHIARQFIATPNANYARVVINGENWGVYVNAQQFNKEFVSEWFGTTEGARWKVPGSPGGRGGLEYLGEDVARYTRLYEIKSKDDPASWAALITLTRTLNETPADRLESALSPLLDIDATLKFLALDAALVNEDGYWTRASDYNLYRDRDGRFHVIPHDLNETFGGGQGGRGMGPGFDGPGRGMRGGPPRGGFGPGRDGNPMPPDAGRGPGPGRGGGVSLDPLAGLDDATKPLRSKLLAVPALREKYLAYVREIADTWLDWQKLEPLVQQYQALIAADVRRDTRKLDSFDAFESGVERLKAFADGRRAFLKARPKT